MSQLDEINKANKISPIRETLNLLTCADSSINTIESKTTQKKLVSYVMCHMSHAVCHLVNCLVCISLPNPILLSLWFSLSLSLLICLPLFHQFYFRKSLIINLMRLVLFLTTLIEIIIFNISDVRNFFSQSSSLKIVGSNIPDETMYMLE